MEQPVPTPTITSLAYFNELCAKSSGPISSHEWKPWVQIPSPVRKNDIYWNRQLSVIMKNGSEMNFSAQAATKKEVEQELARLFLEKAGYTIPSKATWPFKE